MKTLLHNNFFDFLRSTQLIRRNHADSKGALWQGSNQEPNLIIILGVQLNSRTQKSVNDSTYAN